MYAWSALRAIAMSVALLVGVVAAPTGAQEVLGGTGVKGAGSTFVYPVLSRWSVQYRQARARGGDYPVANSGLEDPPASSALEYEPVGSLAGSLRVKDGVVDFGATEMPLQTAELAQMGLGQFPLVIGGVVIAVNIDGVGASEMRLNGPVLANIFLGTIRNWSDPAITALNPALKLPNAPIAVLHRSDGSGTTFTFTDYLSKISPDWKLKVGSALIVKWPVGSGAKGNEGIAQAVKRTKNSIAYVEYAQATQSRLAPALLQNRAGSFVKPEAASFQAAAASADWASTNDFYLLLTDVHGAAAYPLTATVFVLMPRGAKPARTQAALDFFAWSLTDGARTASQLGYVPLPEPVVKQVRAYWAKNFRL
jgi:phosphate transport system substrate-binding protein